MRDAATLGGATLRSVVVDGLIAIALFVLGIVNIATTAGSSGFGPGGLGIAIVAAQTLPLLFRRRMPLLALVVVATASSIPPFIGSIGDNLFSLLAVTIAVYTVAAYARVGAAIAGVLIALAGGMVHQLPQMDGFDPLFLAFAWLPMGAAAFVGSQVQLSRRRLTATEREAQLLVLEKEADSRRAVSEERARIARELHDVVAHNMTSMALQAGAARLYFDSNPEQARQVLASIEAGSRRALAEMRRLLGVLRTNDDDGLELAPQPTLAQVEDLVASSEAAGLPVELSIEGEAKPLSPGLDLTAFRILQESLTNALKYGARSDPTAIVVRYLPSHLELSVLNHARVPSKASEPGAGGKGLVGIKERAMLFKGEFHAGATDDGRFEVRVKLPLEPVI